MGKNHNIFSYLNAMHIVDLDKALVINDLIFLNDGALIGYPLNESDYIIDYSCMEENKKYILLYFIPDGMNDPCHYLYIRTLFSIDAGLAHLDMLSITKNNYFYKKEDTVNISLKVIKCMINDPSSPSDIEKDIMHNGPTGMMDRNMIKSIIACMPLANLIQKYIKNIYLLS